MKHKCCGRKHKHVGFWGMRTLLDILEEGLSTLGRVRKATKLSLRVLECKKCAAKWRVFMQEKPEPLTFYDESAEPEPM